jgi:integrase
MANHELPDLTLILKHDLPSNRHWDLTRFLFPSLAGLPKRKANALLDSGKAGEPALERLPLLAAIRNEIAADIARGKSPITIVYHLNSLRSFYSWGSALQRRFTLSTIDEDYCAYAEHLFYRARRKENLTEESARTIAGSLASILTQALERKNSLISYTRLRSSRNRKSVLGTQADKQNLQETFAFGNFLLTVVSALTLDAISGPLPVRTQLSCGRSIELWSGHKPKRDTDLVPSAQAVDLLQNGININVLQGTRFSLINLAVEAQLLIFISQTGMNLSQAMNLRAGSFRYQSHSEGYKVFRAYKARRKGTVEFEIPAGYRAVFESYMEWRRVLFPHAGEDAAFFSFVGAPRLGGGVKQRSIHMMGFQRIKKLCSEYEIPYFSPQKLRKSKVNWLLRHSDDPALTAEIAQHSQEVLLRQYAQPHHQRAAAEITRFHAHMDPKIAMPGAGVCVNSMPVPVNDIPKHAPAPDCQSPAGCLFCTHQRDIEDFDHTWSLATYRYLKSQELARQSPPALGTAPAAVEAVMDRLTEKLSQLRDRSDVCDMWVREAMSRIEEGDFHPKWDGFIQLIEAQTT